MMPQTWRDVNGKTVKVGDWCVIVGGGRFELYGSFCEVVGPIESPCPPELLRIASAEEWCEACGPPIPQAYYPYLVPHSCLLLIEPDEVMTPELAEEEA